MVIVDARNFNDDVSSFFFEPPRFNGEARKLNLIPITPAITGVMLRRGRF
jgi:hypothetical protein